MAWGFKNSWVNTEKPVAADFNAAANDIRGWGGNVNGGGYELSNVHKILVDTSGYVAGAVRDKGGQVFNVMAYGAIGDGLADDTAAIVAAIAAAYAAGGGIVFFPAGTYKVTYTITVSAGVTLTGPPAGMSSYATGLPATINFTSTNTVLFSVLSDHVHIKSFKLSQTGGTAVNGSVAIDVLNGGGGGSARAGSIEDLDINAFYRGLVVDGTESYVQRNIQVHNCEYDGVTWRGAQGYKENIQSVNNKGHGFKIAPATYSSTVDDFMQGIHSYGNGGWDVYATTPVEILDFYFNASSLGNVYMDCPTAADCGMLSHGKLEYAGTQPNPGYPAGSNTAPGVYVAATSGQFRVMDVDIFNPQGNGIDFRNTGSSVLGGKIIAPGQGGQADNVYAVRASGALSMVIAVNCGGPTKVLGDGSVVVANTMWANSGTLPTFHIPSGLRVMYAGNNITQAGAAAAVQIDAGVTLIDGYNSVVGTVTNNGAAATNNTPAVARNTWQAASLQNSWVDFGAPYAAASYWLSKEGVVHLRGLIKNGTTTDGTTLFTLASGYRPSADRVLTIMTSGGVARVAVGTVGTVAIFGVTSSSWLSLDVCFAL